MNHGLRRIFSYEALDPEEPHHKVACMNIVRKDLAGKGYRVVIPLAHAYMYVETGDLIEKSVKYASILFNGVFSKSDVVAISTIIDNGLDELIQSQPAPERTRADLENEMDRLGIKFTVNGTTIIDATG